MLASKAYICWRNPTLLVLTLKILIDMTPEKANKQTPDLKRNLKRGHKA